jgi:osmotically-inducible protein OsmY
MKFIIGLIFGVVIGVGVYWFVENKDSHTNLQQRAQDSLGQARASASNTASNVSDSLRAKMDALDLRADEIKADLAKTGKVVRRKAEDLGADVADAAADTRVVAAIKAKYTVDPDLSVWQISVSSTDGHVTLSGTVSTPEAIGKAVALALDVSGVRDVISTLQVKNNG